MAAPAAISFAPAPGAMPVGGGPKTHAVGPGFGSPFTPIGVGGIAMSSAGAALAINEVKGKPTYVGGAATTAAATGAPTPTAESKTTTTGGGSASGSSSSSGGGAPTSLATSPPTSPPTPSSAAVSAGSDPILNALSVEGMWARNRKLPEHLAAILGAKGQRLTHTQMIAATPVASIVNTYRTLPLSQRLDIEVAVRRERALVDFKKKHRHYGPPKNLVEFYQLYNIPGSVQIQLVNRCGFSDASTCAMIAASSHSTAATSPTHDNKTQADAADLRLTEMKEYETSINDPQHAIDSLLHYGLRLDAVVLPKLTDRLDLHAAIKCELSIRTVFRNLLGDDPVEAKRGGGGGDGKDAVELKAGIVMPLSGGLKEFWRNWRLSEQELTKHVCDLLERNGVRLDHLMETPPLPMLLSSRMLTAGQTAPIQEAVRLEEALLAFAKFGGFRVLSGDEMKDEVLDTWADRHRIPRVGSWAAVCSQLARSLGDGDGEGATAVCSAVVFERMGEWQTDPAQLGLIQLLFDESASNWLLVEQVKDALVMEKRALAMVAMRSP